MFGLDRLQLDGDFLAGDDVDPKINVTCCREDEQRRWQPKRARTKGTRPYLFPEPVLAAHSEIESVRGAIGHRLDEKNWRVAVSKRGEREESNG